MLTKVLFVLMFSTKNIDNQEGKDCRKGVKLNCSSFDISI